MKVFNLFFLGPQGSGKGTQARLLADKLNLVVIDAGASLREMAKEDTDLARRVHEIINVKGELVEPALIAEVIQQKLLKISREQGIIIDGFPRTLQQYQLLREFWPGTGRGDYQALLIDLTEEESIRRLSMRVTCELCGSVYIAGQYDSCQNCGGKLIQRDDDKPEAIRKRLDLYRSETQPMIAEFVKEGKLITVDGASSIDSVHQEILQKLGF
jgi:adenylate kinase